MMEGYTILSLLLCLSVASAFSDYDVRLAGSDEANGRVEIFYDGNWGTVCDDSWDTTDAGVVCRQLGFPEGASVATSRATFGQGSGKILLDDVSCTGDEERITDCYPNNIGQPNNCGHSEDAGVRCRGDRVGVFAVDADGVFAVDADGDVRLVGSVSSASQGRVEVYANGQWGTVCDDGWGQNDADVVCNQLGFPGASGFTKRAEMFGEGTVPILLDNVNCVGDETSILDCRKNAIGRHNCAHSEDAGVICNKDKKRKVEDFECYEKEDMTEKEKVAAEERSSDDKKDADLKKKDVLQALADLLAKLKDK